MKQHLHLLSALMLMPGFAMATTLPPPLNAVISQQLPINIKALSLPALPLPGPLASSPIGAALSNRLATLQPQLSSLAARLPVQAIGSLPIALPGGLVNGLESLALDDRLPTAGSDLLGQVQSLLAAQTCTAQTLSQPTVDFSSDNATTLKPIPVDIEVICANDSNIYFSTSESLLPGTTDSKRWAVALRGSARTIPAWIRLSPKNANSLHFKISAAAPTTINLQVNLEGFDPRLLEASMTLEPLQTTKLFVYQDLGQELQQQINTLLPSSDASRVE